MTISTLAPVNVTNGAAVNPLQGNTWVPTQIKYLAVYNTGPVPVQVTTQTGTKIIQANNADYVPTSGANVSIQLAPGTAQSSDTIIFTVCDLVVYDDAEPVPQGFPYTLPPPQPNTAVTVAYKAGPPPGQSGVIVFVPKGTIGLILMGFPGQLCTVQGLTSNSIFCSNAPTGNSGTLEVNVQPGEDDFYIVSSEYGKPLTVQATSQSFGTAPPPELLDVTGYIALSVESVGWEIGPSPRGKRFGQALFASANSGQLQTLPGSSSRQGAVTGPFTAEVIYTPSPNSTANFPSGTIWGRTLEWAIEWDNGTRLIAAYVWDGSGTPIGIVSTVPLTAGIPYHLALSWDGTDMWLYVNGVSQGSAPVANLATPNDTTVLQLGSTGATPSGDSFDEARIGGVRYYSVSAFIIPQSPLEEDNDTGVLFHFDNGDAPEDGNSFTVPIPQPAGGFNWTYTLPFAAQLRDIITSYAASSTAITRYPYFIITLPNGSSPIFVMTLNGITASQTFWLTAYLGGPPLAAIPIGGASERGLPDYGLLPAGTVIESGVINMEAGDQWGEINLVFKP